MKLLNVLFLLIAHAAVSVSAQKGGKERQSCLCPTEADIVTRGATKVSKKSSGSKSPKASKAPKGGRRLRQEESFPSASRELQTCGEVDWPCGRGRNPCCGSLHCVDLCIPRCGVPTCQDFGWDDDFPWRSSPVWDPDEDDFCEIDLDIACQTSDGAECQSGVEIRAGDTVQITYTLTNLGDNALTIDEFRDGFWNNILPLLNDQDLTLQPGDSLSATADLFLNMCTLCTSYFVNAEVIANNWGCDAFQEYRIPITPSHIWPPYWWLLD